LEKGLTIGTGANNHPKLVDQFTTLAKEMDMPFAMEAMPVSSGTDGMAIQVSASGIPLEVLGVAIRYMHTSVEMVGMNDIYRTGRLMARFITGLNADSMKTLFEEKKS
jgi:tetrahedral aminopeptidase